MNIDNVPLEVLEWIGADILLKIPLENGYIAGSDLGVKYPEYFIVFPVNPERYHYTYTEKALAIYYYLML